MRQHFFVLRMALTALLVTALASVAAAQSGRVNGVVKDDDGQPIKGATITAENENIGASLTASTDDKGRFSMIGLRPGQWTFIAQAPAHAADGGRLAVRAASNLNPPMTFTLKRTSPGIGGALERVNAKDLQGKSCGSRGVVQSEQMGRGDRGVSQHPVVGPAFERGAVADRRRLCGQAGLRTGRCGLQRAAEGRALERKGGCRTGGDQEPAGRQQGRRGRADARGAGTQPPSARSCMRWAT